MSGVAPDDGIGHRSSFRPDIEGLRAVAVLLVLIYHAQLPWFGGGFIGVDVFFVVSGFLITGLIVRELQETGSVNLPAFYARRARRLLPAAALVILVTVGISIVVLPPLRLPDLAIDGAAAALYVPNIRFAIQATDYLQADFDPSPLLHYWSLGVEEQFYLFWPALLLLATRLAGVKRWTGAIVAVVAIVGLISLVLSLLLTQVDAPLAFFLLPARAWELALGALVFLAARRLSAIPRWPAVLASAVGLALIVGAGAVINVATPFPALPPCSRPWARRWSSSLASTCRSSDPRGSSRRLRPAGWGAFPTRCISGTGRFSCCPPPSRVRRCRCPCESA